MATQTNREIVHEYIKGVLNGKITAGKLVKDACRRHVDDLKQAKKKGWYFDEDRANRAINIARMLTLSSGEYNDMPFELEAFQMFITWCLFGWLRISDSMRRFRIAFISVASGNGKTPFAAFIVILCMAFDEPIEARAECYAVSTKDDQAKRVFDEVAAFRSKDPNLAELIEKYKNTMYVPLTGAKLELIGAEGTVDDGMIPHVAIVDELHRFRNHHRQTLDTIKAKMAKRRQPLLVYITTAGDETSEVWITEYNFARMVVERDNKIEADDLFVYIAQIDDKDDPLDEKNWEKANPMLPAGVVKIDGLRSMAARARVDPSQKNNFTRLNTNLRVTSKNKVITSELWASGNEALPDLTGLTSHGGLDWGWKEDIAALAYVFPLEPVEIEGTLKRRVAVKLRAWIPENGRRDLTMEPWHSWIHKDKCLEVTHGQVTDPQSIYGAIEEDGATFGIGTIAMDPNNCRAPGVHIETELGIPSFWFGQTCGKYNEPVQEFLDMLVEGRLVHGGNPLLAWSAMNLVLRKDGRGYRMPDKERSEEKIDPICAVIMALSEVMFAELGPQYGYYENNDVEAA